MRHTRRTRLMLVLLATLVAAGAGLAWTRGRRTTPRDALRKSVAALDAGDAATAADLADLAFRVTGGDPDAAEVSALAHAAQGDLPAALARLESAARADRRRIEPALQAGLVARALAPRSRNGSELRTAAMRWFDEATRRADAAAPTAGFPAHVLAACARIAANDAVGALVRLDRVAAVSAEEIEAVVLLRAAALCVQRNWPAALRLLTGELARAPSQRLESAVRRVRAWAGEHAAASIADASSDLQRLCDAALQLARTEDDAAFTRLYETVGAAPGGAGRAAFLRGCHHLARHRNADAVETLDDARKALPGALLVERALLDAHLALLAESKRAGQLTLRIAELEHDAASRPADPFPRLILGAAALLRGDARAAEASFRRALAIRPSSGLAANELACVLADRLDRPAEAIEFAEIALRAAPGSAQVLDTAGWVRFRCGDVAGGAPLVARAHRAVPDDPSISAHHSRIEAALAREGPR